MKEEYEWYYSQEADEMEKELKTLFNGKANIKRARYGFEIEHKYFGFFRWWLARIYVDIGRISVADKKYSSILKEFGERHNFELFVKEYHEDPKQR